MGGAIQVSGWVDHLDEIAVVTADQVLRETGMLLPPTVHILAEGLDPPYVGYLTCRTFYRGQDARNAIGLLGLLPSALGASRLVVTWEHADLCTALELPGDDGFPPGVVVVDASRNGHTLRWHPMRMHAGPVGRNGAQTVIPEWGPSQQHQDAVLPEPVADLLAVWRQPRAWPDTELLKTSTSLETTGYEMRWVKRPTTGQQPSWVRLLSPVIN